MLACNACLHGLLAMLALLACNACLHCLLAMLACIACIAYLHCLPCLHQSLQRRLPPGPNGTKVGMSSHRHHRQRRREGTPGIAKGFAISCLKKHQKGTPKLAPLSKTIWTALTLTRESLSSSRAATRCHVDVDVDVGVDIDIHVDVAVHVDLDVDVDVEERRERRERRGGRRRAASP